MLHLLNGLAWLSAEHVLEIYWSNKGLHSLLRHNPCVRKQLKSEMTSLWVGEGP